VFASRPVHCHGDGVQRMGKTQMAATRAWRRRRHLRT
jgi:hypothetical protein